MIGVPTSVGPMKAAAGGRKVSVTTANALTVAM